MCLMQEKAVFPFIFKLTELLEGINHYLPVL
jgi:hypothetical protein